MICIQRVCVWMIWAIILIPFRPLSSSPYNSSDTVGPTAKAKPDFIALWPIYIHFYCDSTSLFHWSGRPPSLLTLRVLPAS